MTATDAGKKRPPLFERLKQSLEKSIEFTQGKADLRTIEIPDAPPELKDRDVVQIRERLALSQAVFARLLNVSTKTVQSWEQGIRRPSQASLRLLQIVAANPNVVYQTVTRETKPARAQRDRKQAVVGQRKAKSAR